MNRITQDPSKLLACLLFALSGCVQEQSSVQFSEFAIQPGGASGFSAQWVNRSGVDGVKLQFPVSHDALGVALSEYAIYRYATSSSCPASGTAGANAIIQNGVKIRSSFTSAVSTTTTSVTFEDLPSNVDPGTPVINAGLSQCYLVRAVGPLGEDASATNVFGVNQLATLNLSAIAGPLAGGAITPISWTFTAISVKNTDQFNIDYSTDGTTWNSIATVASMNGPLTAQAFSTNWTVPLINSSSTWVRVTFVNNTNGATISSQTPAFLVDSTGPTISSFSLAGGSATTSNPSVSVAITGSDNLTSVTQMQFSEATTPGTSWMPFATTATFTLSQTNGSKTVHAWLKDTVGNVSAAATANISLDFGSPPAVSISSPTAGATYASGQNVPISWSCSSANGLDANPARLSYTTDDGKTFTLITGWIPNNATATTGTYNWPLPAGVTTFRLLAECKSAAGVVASSYSSPLNTSGWSIFAGDPASMSENISATLALMITDGSYWQSIATDSAGNIFFAKGTLIMKVDHLSGLVTRFAGNPDSGWGCSIQAGTDPLTTNFNSMGYPAVIGANVARDSLILNACGKFWLFNTSTRALSVLHSSPPSMNHYFLSRTGNLFYDNSNRLYKLDLTKSEQIPVLIHGDGTCNASSGAVGSAADASPYQSAVGSNTCNGEPYYFVNADDSKVWVGCWNGFAGCGPAWRLDWNAGLGKYVIGANNLPWTFQDWDIGWCSASGVYNRIWCNSRWATSSRSTFNLSTETWEARPALAGNMFIRYAPSPTGMVSLSSTNILNSYIENSDGTINTIQIGGSNIETYGNGTDLTKVAFSTVDDITYATTTGDLMIRTAGGLRRIEMPAYPTVSIDTYNWSNPGSSWNRVTFNRSGTKAAFPVNWCGTLGFVPYSVSASSVASPAGFYNILGCNSGVRLPQPIADGTAISGNNFGWENLTGQNDRPLMHSNGKQYLFVTNSNNNAVLYSSDGTTLRWIAGRSGANGYAATDSGNLASGALLNYVSWIAEVPAGSPNAGDLLILDGARLRLITVTTQSAGPKITDLLDLSSVAGYPAGAAIMDFWYDSSTELSNGTSFVVGSGAMYFVTSTNDVYKVTPLSLTGNTVSSAVLKHYTITGTTFSGTSRIALTPAGLLVTQPNKSRILRVAP